MIKSVPSLFRDFVKISNLSYLTFVCYLLIHGILRFHEVVQLIVNSNF